MPKPDWLKESERNSDRSFPMCKDCAHFGRPVKETRHKGKDRCYLHECDIHPGCLNTMYSIGCEDHSPMR